MGEAVDESLSHLKPSDITAMVAYLRTVPSVASDLAEPRSTPPATAQLDASDSNTHGKEVYEGACAGCHGWTGASPVMPFATLLGTRSVNDPSGNNVAQVIIHGGERHLLIDPDNMPDFGSTYSDVEIAAVANYVTARYGVKASDLTAERIAKLRNED
jgi:mono/diheme cytochrome c family protein